MIFPCESFKWRTLEAPGGEVESSSMAACKVWRLVISAGELSAWNELIVDNPAVETMEVAAIMLTVTIIMIKGDEMPWR